MEETLASLQNTDPFNSFPRAVLRHLLELSKMRTYAPGEFISYYGDAWPYMVFIEMGSLEAIKESAEGRSLLVYQLKQGDVFWGLTFFNDLAKMPISLRAVEQSRILIWPREDILPLLLEHPQTLWSICGILIQRVQVASAIVEDLAFQPVAGRLAKMLIETYGGRGSEPLARDLTLDEMAARVGTTREMVCRILYKFADEKWIDITRTEFRLVDQEGLRNLSGNLPSGET
jgi:CRP/FNR family transcriptional regulator